MKRAALAVLALVALAGCKSILPKPAPGPLASTRDFKTVTHSEAVAVVKVDDNTNYRVVVTDKEVTICTVNHYGREELTWPGETVKISRELWPKMSVLMPQVDSVFAGVKP